jgi:hypothetical protein
MNAPIRRDGVLGQARASEARLVTFPNPVAAGSVRLGFSRHVRGPVSVQVFDAAGRVVHRAVVTPAGAGPTAVLDLGSLSNGVYLMKLEFEGTVARHKLVLER